MKYLQYVLAFILIITAGSAFSQEVIYPLNTNNTLTNHRSQSSNVQRVASTDTAYLPFIDDFSLNSMYPTDSLWMDRNVYVNNNYSANPVTIGIATFDGLDEFGQPYQTGSVSDSIADFLTSRPLRLQLAPGDTNAWLSFFYQPQGLGDCPEPVDSFILQFKDTTESWNTVWAVPGRCDSAFRRVNIKIEDPKYFFNGFQFRFYNIATVNGNRDHWNLDYVILRRNTIENTPIADFGFLHPQRTMLTEYTSMPYTHYKAPGVASSLMKTTMVDTIRNFDYGPSTVAPFINVSDSLGLNNTFTYPSLIVGLNLQRDTSYTMPLNGFQFPTGYAGDSMRFLVKSYSDSPINQNKFNDSSFYYQNFYNYYSYDDGSAEVAYGLTGNFDVSAAYQFDIKMRDTLRGVQIYFNPTGINIANKLFQLTVWSDINLGTHTSVEMYRMINQKPDTFDGINVFKTYLFDTLLVVGPGNIWVGMIQNEPQTLYGIGFDRNTDSRNKMFYHIDGFWHQSILKGSWMIRPLFGKRIPSVNIEELSGSNPSFILFPNPASNVIHLQSEKGKLYRYQIYDSLGSLVTEGRTSGDETIDVSALAKGLYIVRLMNSSSLFTCQKLIVE